MAGPPSPANPLVPSPATVRDRSRPGIDAADAMVPRVRQVEVAGARRRRGRTAGSAGPARRARRRRSRRPDPSRPPCSWSVGPRARGPFPTVGRTWPCGVPSSAASLSTGNTEPGTNDDMVTRLSRTGGRFEPIPEPRARRGCTRPLSPPWIVLVRTGTRRDPLRLAAALVALFPRGVSRIRTTTFDRRAPRSRQVQHSFRPPDLQTE